ncbi:MAG: NAD(P)/FAD-dependent oxidoreductase [Parachlamydiaceae bacterium]|nr:NAD(P)/FAD-dependent oxidoreductase [Parachlamydiaceae bacterium]
MIRQKVLILGGGFGGLNAAKALKKANVDILLIDKSNHHLFQPLLYQVATAVLSPGDIAFPLREILAKQANVTVLLADITSINKIDKNVVAANGDVYAYDYLILAVGASHSYFGHPEWEQFAPGLKTLPDALCIREKILLSYERAERCENPIEAEKFMRFVIIGAGPTGVEMAGAIAEIAHKSLVNNFRKIKPERTKIYLIEGMDQILPSFPKDLADKGQKALEKLGVDILLNTRVNEMSENGVWIGDQFLEASTIIWAAGNQASSLLKSLDVPLDRSLRVIVNPDLSIPDHPEIFVIGDAACSYNKDGNSLPGIAPVAIQQGNYVANLINQDPSLPRKPFVYFDKGMMATIGKAKAIAMVGKWKFSGLLAWLAWSFIHIVFLISFASRFLVMAEWMILYFSNQRRIRLITSLVKDKDQPLHAVNSKDQQDSHQPPHYDHEKY